MIRVEYVSMIFKIPGLGDLYECPHFISRQEELGRYSYII